MEDRFGLPVLVMPLLDREIRGLPMVTRAEALLFGPAGVADTNLLAEEVGRL